VKALFRRGVARTHLHEYAKARVDLFAAARLDPKSKEVRAAIDTMLTEEALAKERDAKVAQKSLGNPKKAPPGGGLRPPATVFFDIALEDTDCGRVVMEMFPEAPLTCENFRCLCTGERGIGNSKKPLHFEGSPFHRLIPGYIIQGGDIVQGTGMGGDSIYGGMFRDEKFVRKHDQPGLLSMANGGPNTNSSQFFITFAACPHLDNYNVVFGRVASGFEILEKLADVVPTDKRNDRPKKRIWVRACGELPSSASTAASETADSNGADSNTSNTEGSPLSDQVEDVQQGLKAAQLSTDVVDDGELQMEDNAPSDVELR
jgi:cyclophilin family peptidyl-prolyl cis-trans isomerase